ncbi:hypothetical protein GH811_18925 [Acetobacterium malicum]|uniref:Uncharacterized protein n=1 Tax=Acetobacterium malicum TaxID=52692 RepID=A0ABR6Z2N4_9FIRM|nr:hypothetical protein [Acetobacterium malicum]MBC3901669.1 hypothetical protein [Acetobacterium malicum]
MREKRGGRGMSKLELINHTRIMDLHTLLNAFIEQEPLKGKTHSYREAGQDNINKMFSNVIGLKSGDVSKSGDNLYRLRSTFSCGGRISIDKNIDAKGDIMVINELCCFDSEKYKYALTEEEQNKINIYLIEPPKWYFNDFKAIYSEYNKSINEK